MKKYSHQTRRNRGTATTLPSPLPHSPPPRQKKKEKKRKNVDLLPIENDSENIKITKKIRKYKLVQTPSKSP